ncbi:MAG: hydrogenase iron-sulfur subunit [Candidatus Omnitrophica bacterium]|nr:hydrogenase iron-sulfur subunit [Candidatus Omnitrophota bacterium]
MSEQFQPKVVAFLCNWCSYSGADAAGRAQRKVPAELVRIVRVMCTGRIDPQFVLEAFRQGADGVLILGCHPGDCHYKEGNYKMLKRHAILEQVLSDFGIEKQRYCLDWVSASEGEKFIRVAGEMIETVRALGPLRLPHTAESKETAV